MKNKLIKKTVSKTPLKDNYEQRLDNLDISKRYNDISKLNIGDHVNIPGEKGKTSGLTGFVKKYQLKILL